MTIGGIIANLTDIFGSVISMTGTVASTVTSTPLVLMFVLIPIVGIGVGLFKRLLNVN